MSTEVVMSGGSPEAKAIINKYEKLKQRRQTWDNHWRQIAEYVQPLKDDVYGQDYTTKGEKKNNKLFDSIGVTSNDKLASELHGMFVNPMVIWFGFSTRDITIDNIPAVAKWLQTCARIQNGIQNASNLQTEIMETFLDLPSFGTGRITVEEDAADYVRYTARPIYEAAISENHLGEIDTVYYDESLTIDKLIDRYGDSVPSDIRKKQESDPLMEFVVVRCVEPTHRLPKKVRHSVFPFTSVHVLKEKAITLKVGGFEENPEIIGRMSKKAGEMYGRSPAMKALSDIKYANFLAQCSLEAHLYNAHPTVQIPDDGVLLPVQVRPKGKIFYKAGSKDRVERLDLGTDVRLSEARIDQLHAKIKEAFYLDKFSIPENDRMTATEVMQRRDENLRGMSPITGRIQKEILSPLVMRTFKILARRGVFPPVPKEIQDKELDVVFTSQLTRAQDSIDADSFLRAFQATLQIAQTNPEVADVIDADKSTKFLFKSYGAPLDLLKTDAKITEVRKQRQDAIEQQQQLDAAKTSSETARNLSEAGNVQQG